MTANSHTYEFLADMFASAGLTIGVAELHGGICGAICVGGIEAADAWLRDSLSDDEYELEMAEDLAQALRHLRVDTWSALAGTEMGFEPLLPADDEPVHIRVAELALWCHGFIGGLGAAGLKFPAADPEFEEQLREILQDFSEISRATADADDSEPDELAESSLVELTEYLRVSVQIVYEGLLGRHPSRRNESIH